MLGDLGNSRVYLALEPTDMRRGIDGLGLIVSEVLQADPFSQALYVFCNRRRDKLKILQWHNNGFWLHYRRLERHRFRWPRATDDTAALEITRRQLLWLLDGLALEQPAAHPTIRYEKVG